jgi:hypothetical protein
MLEVQPSTPWDLACIIRDAIGIEVQARTKTKQLRLEAARHEAFVQLRVKSSNIVPSVDRCNETRALLPSFLQRRTSIDTMS